MCWRNLRRFLTRCFHRTFKRKGIDNAYMKRHLLTLPFIMMGCVGEAEWALAPGEGPGSKPGVMMVAFQGLSDGLPAQPALAGTAQLDGTLYAVANGQLYALSNGMNRWSQVENMLKASEHATSVARLDLSIYLTAADGAGHGGLYRLSISDDAFARVAGAPDKEVYAIVKKDGALLMTTPGALLVSKDQGATWTVRSSDPIFTSGVSALVASPSALRMFAVVSGKLWHSDDSGATWSDGQINGLGNGQVTAIQAAGAYVLLQTDAGTLRSDNYGNTFHAVDVGGTVGAFAISGLHAFAGTGSGLRVSEDGGATWVDASRGLPAGSAVRQLYLSGGALVASTGEAVYVAQVQ